MRVHRRQLMEVEPRLARGDDAVVLELQHPCRGAHGDRLKSLGPRLTFARGALRSTRAYALIARSPAAVVPGPLPYCCVPLARAPAVKLLSLVVPHEPFHRFLRSRHRKTV